MLASILDASLVVIPEHAFIAVEEGDVFDAAATVKEIGCVHDVVFFHGGRGVWEGGWREERKEVRGLGSYRGTHEGG